MAKKNIFQRIKDWFTGGNNGSNRASSYRGSSNTRATNNYTGYRTKSEDDERKRKAEEQKAKIEKAFAVSVNTKADDSKSKKRVDTSNKSTKAWRKTAEKELGVTDAKSNRLAQLDSKYWQKQEEHSAKYNPIALSMAKGAVSGTTLNADKLLVSRDKNAKANQEKIQKIMEKSGGEKAVKRAEILGEVGGTLASFGLGTTGARAGFEGSKAVAKASSKLANSEIIKKASARAIEKGLAKGSLEEVSQQLANKVATQLLTDASVDNTLGLALATNDALQAEKGERAKTFAKDYAINAGATGLMDLAPTLVRGLKGAKSLKNVEKKELEKAVEEVAKSELPKQAEKEAVPNIGYHAGTLNGSKKAEPFSISNGDRGTGHYGTGTYIAGNKDLLDYEHSGYSDRDLWEIDMDNYKLFRPKDADEAGRLHSSLKEINSRSRKYNSVKDIDFEDLRQRVANGDDDAYEQLLKYVDKDDLAKYERRAKEYIEQYEQAPTKEEIRSEAIRQLEKESREADLYDLDFDDFMKAIDSGDYSGISSTKPELTESQIADRIAQLEGKYRDESNLQARIRKEVEFEADKILEPYIEVESLTKDRTDEFGDLYSSTYSKLKKLFPDIEESELKRAFDETMDEVERINNLPYNAQLTADSPSTILMKKLGYDGIDVRGIKGYDNTTYGSVIYDLDKSRAKKIREGKAELPATETKEVTESPTASVLEQDLKNIEEGKPLEPKVEMPTENAELPTEMPTAKPVEPPAPKAEVPKAISDNVPAVENGKAELPIADKNADSNSPYVAGTLKQNMERNGMDTDEYADLFDALGDMKVETIYRDFSSKDLSEIYDMSEIKPVAELEAEGVAKAETQTTSYTDQILFKEEYEKIRKESRDSKDVNISQSNLKEQAMAKTAEHRRKVEESVRKKSEEYKKTLELTTQQRLDRDGVSANEIIDKSHDALVSRKRTNTIDAYDASFEVIHTSDIGHKCAMYVSQNPALVMKYLHEKITKNIPWVSADYFFADALIDYGQIWGKSSAIEIGKLAKNGYAINTGRNSGVMEYCSRIFHSLEPSQKIRAISKMFVDITNAVGKHADNTQDLIESLNTFYKDNVADLINMRAKEDNGAFKYTIDMLNGENPPSYVDVLVDNIVHSTDEKFIANSQDLLRKSATEMCPPNILSTWIAIRFTSMLSNIKTHVKNLMGGVGVALTKGISDVMAGAVQEALYKSGAIKERSRAILSPAEFKDNVISAKGEYGDIIKTVGAEDIKGIKKHTRGLWDRNFDRSSSKKIPKLLKPIFVAQKVIGTGLELEDGVFIEYFYRKSLCEYLKANGYKAGADFVPTERFKDAETLLKVARAYARDEAKEATFRKFNSLSKFLNDATRKGTSASATTMQQVGGFVSHTAVPFTTPINMFVQGVKYSPLSLATGVHNLIKASKGGSEELYLKAIDDLCAGMTGVGIAGLGFWLGRNQPMAVGVHLVGSMNDDPESKAYKREGIQEYSLVKINDDGKSGFSLNFDALQPIAQTLFMGAEMGKQSLHDDWDGGSGFYDEFGNILTVMSSVAGPIVNMSAVQGLSKLLEAPQNYPDLDAVSAMFVSLAESNKDSLVASFMSNLTRSLSAYDYNLTGTSSTKLGNTLQYQANMTSSKLPFAGKRLAPKINEFGEIVGEKKLGEGDYAKALLNNMVNPLTAKSINLNDIQVEQHRLYGSLVSAGEDPEKAGAIFPYVDNRVNKTIGENSDKYGVKAVELEPMNQWERAEWQKAPSKNGNEAKIALLNTKGWNSFYGGDDDKTKARRAEVEAMDFESTKDLLNWTITQPEYINATDKQKKQMISAVYGKAEYSGNKELYTSRGGSEAEFKLIEDVGAKYRGAWENNKDGIANIVTLEQYVDFALKAKKEYYADDGTRTTRYTSKSMKEYFNDKDLSYEQREALYNTYKAKGSRPYSGQGSSGGSRGRGGGSSSSKSSTKSQAKLSAFKPSVKKSDFKSITKNINQDYGKVKREFGLTDAELQAIIKQANRDSLSLRGK